MSSIELKSLEKSFDNLKVIKNINLFFKKGEFIVLVGPSGCGKSTLLRIIAGLEEADNGKIYLDKKDISNKIPSERGLSMVFQSYALYPHMNVRNNIGFSLKNSGVKKSIIDKKISKISKILELDEYLERFPKQLSGGQRQRVAIGRAIIREPKGFLFDEPLSNLDASLRSNMRVEISKLHKNLGITSIYVTHDQVEAMTLADRIVVLNNGEVMQFGTPQELYNKPTNKFVAEFLGSPKMNFLECVVKNKKIYVKQDKIKNYIALQNKNTNLLKTIGIRPEHIKIIKSKNASCDGIVELVEYLGSDIFLYVKCQKQTVVVRVNSKSEIIIGDKVNLLFLKKHIHFFDVNGFRI